MPPVPKLLEQLNPADTLSGSELFYIRQGSGTFRDRKLLLSDLKEYIGIDIDNLITLETERAELAESAISSTIIPITGTGAVSVDLTGIPGGTIFIPTGVTSLTLAGTIATGLRFLIINGSGGATNIVFLIGGFPAIFEGTSAYSPYILPYDGDAALLTKSVGGFGSVRIPSLKAIASHVSDSLLSTTYDLLQPGLGAWAGPGGSYTNINATKASLKVAKLASKTFAVRIDMDFISAGSPIAVPSAWYSGTPPGVGCSFKTPSLFSDPVINEWLALFAAEPTIGGFPYTEGGIGSPVFVPTGATYIQPWHTIMLLDSSSPKVITIATSGALGAQVWGAGNLNMVRLNFIQNFSS